MFWTEKESTNTQHASATQPSNTVKSWQYLDNHSLASGITSSQDHHHLTRFHKLAHLWKTWVCTLAPKANPEYNTLSSTTQAINVAISLTTRKTIITQQNNFSYKKRSNKFKLFLLGSTFIKQDPSRHSTMLTGNYTAVLTRYSRNKYPRPSTKLYLIFILILICLLHTCNNKRSSSAIVDEQEQLSWHYRQRRSEL